MKQKTDILRMAVGSTWCTFASMVLMLATSCASTNLEQQPAMRAMPDHQPTQGLERTFPDVEADARIAQLVPACAQNSPAACFDLGRAHETTREAPDMQAAVLAYDRACRLGHAQSCSRAGIIYALGEGVEIDFARVAVYYKRAQYIANGIDSSELDIWTSDGNELVIDLPRVVDLYRRGCNKGDMPSCFNLAIMYDGGVGVDRDMRRAWGIYKRACRGGEERACTLLGSVKEAAYEKQPTIASFARREAIYDQNCGQGHVGACLRLAELYDNRRKDSADLERAHRFFERACKLGAAEACHRAGGSSLLIASGRGSMRDARNHLQRACAAGDTHACLRMGTLAEAQEIHSGGTYFTDGQDAEDVFLRALIYKTACDTGLLAACMSLGDMYHDGRSLPQSGELAVALFERACTGNVAPACDRLSAMSDSKTPIRAVDAASRVARYDPMGGDVSTAAFGPKEE